MGFNPTQPRDENGRWLHLARALKEHGGFTHSLSTGKEPTKGFSVSAIGHEQKIPGHASAKQIKAYAEKNRATLATPHAHLGGWFNPEDKTTYLDVSFVHNNKGKAMRQAATAKQLAIFDLGAGKEIWLPKPTTNLSVITPWFKGSSDMDLSVAGKLAFWKQILPVGTINYTASDGSRKKIDFTPEYLADLASGRGVDKIGFLLADKNNAHTMDPERWRGEVAALEVRPNGLYGKIVFPDKKAAKVVLDNPDLGVSARIREGVERSDGSTVDRAIIHVLGTLDPQVSGMESWQTADLSTANSDVLDLTNEEYNMAKASKTERTEAAAPVLFKGKALDDFTDEEINALTEAELDTFLSTFAGIQPEYADDVKKTTEAEKAVVEENKELVGAGAELSTKGKSGDLDLARSEIDLANARANEALRRMAAAEWDAERKAYLAEGVPPHALDLATPVLNRADDMVLDLSNTGGPDLNLSNVVRGLLDAMKGTIDLSAELGHGIVGSGKSDSDDALLAAWKNQS